MSEFSEFKMIKALQSALADMQLDTPSPIQLQSYSPILAGSDFVGIAETGTGKTIAYLLPVLQDLKYSEQSDPRILIIAPTRELVIQIAGEVERLTAYMTIRTLAVYGGTNMNTQKNAIAEGVDVLVATPRRLYDLALTPVLNLRAAKKLIIDEVDMILDFGYATQLRNVSERLPSKLQRILFSATMTTELDDYVADYLINPVRKTISYTGAPLDKISQIAYEIPNFYSKVALLNHLLRDREIYSKVLIFVGTKITADRLHEHLDFGDSASVIHAGKSQNARNQAVEDFQQDKIRILIATDVIARGIDIDHISVVISFDTPYYPDNYLHRIGRTARADREGRAILLYRKKELELKQAIEQRMNYSIPLAAIPEQVKLSTQLTPEERNADRPKVDDHIAPSLSPGKAFHKKSAKNSKAKTKKKSYAKQLKEKYKKPLRRGDKIQNRKKKKKR